jgi:hypothetical protein
MMRNTLIKAVKTHAQGHVDKHIANIEVYLANPAGIGEHSDIVEAIEIELEQIAKYQDQLDIIKQYFPLHKEQL